MQDDLWKQFLAEQDLYQQFLNESRMTARGRAADEAQSRADFEAAAKKSLADPTITPQRRAALEKALKHQGTEGFFDVAPTLGESAKRLVGGAVQSVPATGMALVDLGLATLSPISKTARKGREVLAEGQARLAELTGAKGIEGLAGNLVGGAAVTKIPGITGKILQAPMIPFAKASEKTLQVASKFAPKAVEKVLTGGKAARIFGYAAADVPINLAQSVTIPDASPEEKARAFWTQMLASGIGATISTPRALPKPPKDIQVKSSGTGVHAPKNIQDWAAQAKATGDAKAAERKILTKEVKEEIKKAARIKWQAENPDKDFDTLTSKDRNAVYKTFKDALNPEALKELATHAAERIFQQSARITWEAQNQGMSFDHLTPEEKTAWYELVRNSEEVKSEAPKPPEAPEVVPKEDGTMPEAPSAERASEPSLDDKLATMEKKRRVDALRSVDNLMLASIARNARIGKETQIGDITHKYTTLDVGEEAARRLAADRQIPLEEEITGIKSTTERIKPEELKQLQDIVTSSMKEINFTGVPKLDTSKITGEEWVDLWNQVRQHEEKSGVWIGNKMYVVDVPKFFEHADVLMNDPQIANSTKDTIRIWSRGWKERQAAKAQAASDENLQQLPDVAQPVAEVKPVVEQPSAKPTEPAPTGQGTVKTFYDRKEKVWKTQIITASGEVAGPAVPHDSKHKAVAFGAALAKEINATLVQPRTKKTILDKESQRIADAEQAKVTDLTDLRARVEEAKALAESVSKDDPKQAFAAQKQYRALRAELAAAEAAQTAPISASEPMPAQAPEAGTTTISPETSPSLAPEPASTLPPREPGTYLKTIPSDTPLERINSVDELDDLIDAIDAVHDPEKIAVGEYPVEAQQDIQAIASRKAALKAQARIEITGDPSDPLMQVVEVKSTPNKKPLTGAERRKYLSTPASKLTIEEVQRAYNDLEPRTRELSKKDPESKQYFAKLEELRSRLLQTTEQPTNNPLPGTSGAVLRSHPMVGGALAGFATGMVYGDDPEDWLKYAALGAGAGYGLSKVPGILKPKIKQSIVPKDVLKNVKTGDELNEMKEASSFLERARWMYTRTARSAFGSERYTQDLNLDKAKDPGALASMFGRWIAQAEAWVADKPFFETIDGTVQEIPEFGQWQGQPIRNAADIAKVVDGDTEGLGKLMAARTAIEQYQNTGKVPTGIDISEAFALVNELPEQYHVAANAARNLHLGLLEVLVQKGVISRDAAANMSSERFYAAMERFYTSPDKPIDPINKDMIGSPNPVKGRKGAAQSFIKNPFETMIAVIGRTMRAAEINHIKNAWVDLVEANPKAFSNVIRRIDSNTKGPDGKIVNSAVSEARVAQLKAELGMNTNTIKELVAAFDGDRLDPTNAMLTVFREGNLRTYRVNKFVAESMRALHPVEMNWIWDMLAIPNKFARAGIVNNPVFVANQALRDNWQIWMNSQNGFIPGVDYWNGLRHVWMRSKKWREYLQAGGGQTSFALRDVLSLEKSVAEAKAPGKTAWDGAVKRIKERSYGEAWHELIVPFAEAARMGEYLRARGRGKSPIEAAYAAKHVGGNFQQNGLALRGLNMTALFLNPSIQALDQAMVSAGVHPFRGKNVWNSNTRSEGIRNALIYATKGIAGIAIPSAYLWWANRDDKTIEQLRKSETGRRYWFVRVSGKKDDIDGIIKIPKPIFEGQMFGTSMETMLDKWFDKDPGAVSNMFRAIENDLSVNLLPTVGVVAGSLWANQDYRTGMPITQGASDELSPQLQVNPETSQTSRVVGDKVGVVSRWLQDNASYVPGGETLARALSPAGLDYVTRSLGGTLTHEAWRSMGQAYQYATEGYMPVKEEWPIIRNALVNYPTSGAAALQEFYRSAAKTERVAKDFAAIVKRDPASVGEFVLDHQNDLALAELHKKTRQELADMRQAFQDLQIVKAGQFDPGFVRDTKRQILLAMIEVARATNSATNAMK